ncbi:MAG: peptidylprolyl isomerase [Bdellovibrionia bacterium]
MKEAAVQMVGVLGGEQTPLLKLALKDKNVNVRNAALGNLSSITEGWAFDAIVTATLSKELSERGTAIDALTSRKEDAKVDYAMKAYVNSAGQKWVETREMIVELIRQVPGDVTTKHLFTMLKDPAQSVQARAHQALLDRGIKDLPALPAPVLTHTPYKELEFNNAPIVVLKTSKGDIWIATNPRDAQIHVANFVGYAKAGKYNKLPFHRVVSNFVVQGGDPDKSGWGDAGWAMRAEINHQPFLRGTVGMPRAQGFDTGGIQIFINHVPTPHLDGQYTVFGQVIMGLDVIDRLERGDLILETQVM